MHDRGGWPTDAPIDRGEHELADWELLADALVGALGHQGVLNVDELRRGIESMLALLGGDDPDREGRAHAGRARQAARGVTYRPGERVRVADRRHEGHHRTPGYLKGKVGNVERLHGRFTNPETLSNVVRTTVWAFAIVVAINQLGIATNLINTLFTGFVGALALACGLAFGLGGRDLASRSLENWYDQAQEGRPRRMRRTEE